jgi:hypothetical protein
LLDEAGKSPEYIKKRLCWLGDSFRMYLRDTVIIQHQHVNALLAALQEVMDLIANLPKDVIALSTMTEGEDDPDMYKYADEMDSTLNYFDKLLLLTETFNNCPPLRAFAALHCH